MQRMLVIGDSWGAPPDTDQEIQGRYTAQGHISSRLRDLGYMVENRAIRGAGNLESWQQARKFTTAEMDWCLWFHTELGRDWFREQHPHKWHWETKIQQVSRRVYAEIREHLDYLRPKKGLILVEGQTTRQLPWFYEYLQPQILIEDWRSELLGQRCDVNQIFGELISQPRFLDSCLDSAELKNQWLDQTTAALDMMAQHPDLFPDRCHPGDYAMAELTLRLKKIIDHYE